MTYSSNVSGLNNTMSSIDMIGKNLSNIETTGFKTELLPFCDLFPNTYEKNLEIGMGSMKGKKYYNFDKGYMFKTNRTLDSAIYTNGFFRLQNVGDEILYSKDGHFLLDKEYNLVNKKGFYVTGYDLTKKKLDFQNPHPINLSKKIKITGEPTTVISISTQINSSDIVKFRHDFDPYNSLTYNRMIPISAYDDTGGKYDINLYFVKKTPSIWKIHPVLQNHRVYNKEFLVQFDTNSGKILSKSYQDIIFNKFGESENRKISIDLKNIICKNFDNNSINYPVSYKINGKPSTSITKLSLNKYGMLSGLYDDGSTIMLSQLALTDFPNYSHLVPMGTGFWMYFDEDPEQEKGIIGPPGTGNFGTIKTGEIEGSNVNPERELINMIMAQKNFEALKQSIKSQNEMDHTLINSI
ncbi:flagellar hook-basal body complex protein [Buchnera aphidicola (Thelaxes californica)]|uniref:Flagellar hook protein FlgE n=1 Tax=Buchnera aphidicola (Thelaxes californica) TaxID=1315998 RepID=A0A4D6YNZ6_9GAMM|nr:flagellar hook-basal body complex protein [Buchnera aphidicola]QCI26795.1 flagellar hook-basal body complex protein [Buchnera aphidicola (Thelaxes californica)]